MPESQSVSHIIDTVERAAAELRRGRPVVVSSGRKLRLCMSVEGLTVAELKPLLKAADTTKIRAVITPARAGKKGVPACSFTLSPTAAGLKNLAGIVGLEPFVKMPTLTTGDLLDAAALQMMKHAELLPACISLPIRKIPKDITQVTAKAIAEYEAAVAYSLAPVCRAPLTLQGGKKAEIIGFRPLSGGKEHYAIMVGSGLKSKTPIIRIHSSCYTGDLLGSITCDCRDQLHEAIDFMAAHGGGIVLYLMQEGRGIGLVNKLRAYQLQAEGLDTVEANRALGFDDDERPFLPAASMLKQLGVKKVKLLTNNPRKVRELERFGIKVAARLSHIMAPHTHRERYMGVKSQKMGHMLDK